MSKKNACPSAAEIRDFAAGLSSERSADLEEHLLQCDACARQTAEIRLSDTLVDALREIKRQPTRSFVLEEAVLEHLMAACSALRTAATQITDPQAEEIAGVSPDVVIQELSSAWRPAQQPGALGQLGTYRIVKLLGSGGMGAVFLAEDTQLRRPVALKLIRPRAAASPIARDRFLREARAAAALRHDHIVTIYQVGEENGVPYLAMEHLEGESLDDRLRREGTLPIPEAVRIAGEIAEGLAAAHARGLIHRDVKPANIWLETGRGRVKLLDFGLARMAANDAQLTSSGVIVGTPAYMSPEQARGEAVDARSDLFSLGGVLYRMLTGSPPFAGRDLLSTLNALATAEVVPPRAARPDVPAALNDLVLHLLEKTPARRPASAPEVIQELSAVLAPATKAESLPRGARRRATVVAAGLAAVMLLFAVMIIKFKHPDGRISERRIPIPPGAEPLAPEIVPDPEDEVQTAATSLDHLDAALIPASERFDWQPPELVAVLGRQELRSWQAISEIRFHPSGAFFLVAPYYSHEPTLLFPATPPDDEQGWRPRELRAELGTQYGLQFTRDGTKVFTGALSYQIRTDNPSQPEFTTEEVTAKGSYSADVALFQDRWLISSRYAPGTFDVWDISQHPPKEIKRLTFDADQSLRKLWLSDKGQILAALLESEVRIWEADWTAADGPTLTPRGEPIPANRAALSPDGNHMLVLVDGKPTGRMWRWTEAGFEPSRDLPGSLLHVFAEDSRQLAIQDGDQIDVYRFENGHWGLGHSLRNAFMDRLVAGAFSPDGKTLAVGNRRGSVYVWDLSVDPPQPRRPIEPGNNVERIVFAPDGRSLLAETCDHRCVQWKLDGTRPQRRNLEAMGHASFGNDARLAFVGTSNEGRVWDLSLSPPEAISEPIHGASRLDPASRQVFSFHDHVLFRREWKLNGRGRCEFGLETAVWTSPTPLASSEALDTLQFLSRRFATRPDDTTITVWTLAEPARPACELKHSLVLPSQGNCVTLSPEGNLLAACAPNGDAVVWDLEESPPREYRLKLDSLVSSAFFAGPAESLIVSGERGVVVHDWVRAREVRRFPFPGPVRQVVPHPDGRHLATVNGNGAVYLLCVPELLSGVPPQ